MKYASQAVQVVAFLALVGFVFYMLAKAPDTVAVGLDCQGEQVRIYADGDAPKAAKACRSVQLHKLPS